MADNEPNVGFRFFVKKPDNTISRQITPPESRQRILEHIQLKRSEQVDLSAPENTVYSEIVKDIRKDIIRVYKSAGIEITEEMFPELLLSKKVTKERVSRLYRWYY